MTEYPTVASGRTTVNEALDLMEQFKIRHLPVVDNGKVVGIVSDRDLKKAELLTDAMTLVVSDYMVPHPYTVRVGTPLSIAAREMARKKYGSAIVINALGAVVGIFTTTDALRILADLLSSESSEAAFRRWRIEEALIAV
jgi:CBS domain-containing protein